MPEPEPKIDVAAFACADQVFVAWRPREPIANCDGFALYRKHKERPAPAPGDVDGRAPLHPAATWPIKPIQDFAFSDVDVRKNDVLAYRVVPLRQQGRDWVELTDRTSEWSKCVTVAPQAGERFRAYFNRGIVASQWLTRSLIKGSPASAPPVSAVTMDEGPLLKVMEDAIKKEDSEIRAALAGGLWKPLTKLLEQAKGNVYAAIYLLNDFPLQQRLLALGSRLHLILANSRDPAPSDTPAGAEDAAALDENADARRRLKAGGVVVIDRMLKDARLGHNKFAVFCDEHGKPATVWTGSGNWTRTGLCTQTNNALVIDEPEIASIFKEQWDRLKKDSQLKGKFSKALLKENAKPKEVTVAGGKVTVWFAPVTCKCEPESALHPHETPPADLQHASALIKGARQAVLFLMYTTSSSASPKRTPPCES